MALKKNLLANYVSQGYSAVVGIVVLPIYIKYMGPEAYGLVGFFSMLFAWFSLLDIGLKPTMVRETARFRGGAISPQSFLLFVRSFEGVFAFVGLMLGTSVFFMSGYLANHWLNLSELPVEDVQRCLEFMAFIIFCRWMSGLYRGVVSGSEKILWLSCFNSGFATLRFVVVIPTLIWIDSSPKVFFAFQLCVSALELLTISAFVSSILPSRREHGPIGWSFSPIRRSLNFSLTIAFTSTVWVLITQTDKLILSKLIALENYGYYTMAVVVANGILLVSGPLSTVVMPRMVRLEAQDNQVGLQMLYRKATQFAAVIGSLLASLLFIFGSQIIWLWTGDASATLKVPEIMGIYAIGNGILVVAAFPYYLQFAKGNLRLHLLGNLMFVVILLPSVVIAALKYGGLGAAYVWFLSNLLLFVGWLPVVHKRFMPGINFRWYFEDTLIIFGVAFLSCQLIKVLTIDFLSDARLLLAIQMLCIGASVSVITLFASSFARKEFQLRVAKKVVSPL